jgi:hypothetical protein
MGRLGKKGKAAAAAFILLGLLVLVFVVRSIATGISPAARADAPIGTKGIAPLGVPNPATTRRAPNLPPGGQMPNGDALQAKVALLMKEGVEVCGMSPTEAAYYVASNGRIGGLAESTAALLAEAAGAIVQSADVRERATGLYLQAYLARSAGADERELNDRDCKTPDCRRALTEAWRETARNAAKPLAELARQSRDPAIYAAAVHACQKEETGGCNGISYAGWAQLEPENAAPWMILSEQAKAAGDANAGAKALRRIVIASRVDFRLPDMRPLINASALKEAVVPAQNELLGSMIGVAAATSIEHGMALGNICLRADIWNDERKALCDKLANMMVGSDRSMVGLRMATIVARKLDWTDERIQALQDESDMIMGSWMAEANRGSGFGCEQMTRDVQRSKESLTIGERAVAREQVAKSGKTMQELAEDYRKTLKPAS